MTGTVLESYQGSSRSHASTGCESSFHRHQQLSGLDPQQRQQHVESTNEKEDEEQFPSSRPTIRSVCRYVTSGSAFAPILLPSSLHPIRFTETLRTLYCMS